MKRIAFVLALGSMTALAGAQTAKAHLTGWIGDSKCGAAMHTKACVTKCVQSGQKPVFVDSKNNKVWAIDNTDAVSNYYGDKVKVVATVDSANKSIHIDKVKKARGMCSM